MRQKKCKSCGVLFETDKQGAYMCPACALASRQASVYRERVCIECGAAFMGFPRSKRCPSCQAEKDKAAMRKYRRSGPARPLGSKDFCQRCGAEYVVEGGLQRYCKTCAADAVADNSRARKRQYNLGHKDVLYPAKAENRRYNKVCVVCGNVFDSDKPTVTCSPECAKERRRQQQKVADQNRSPRNRKKEG